MWPPPGVWWAFSREPTFAWALSLKSSFTVSMRTLPPPENRREDNCTEDSKANKKKAEKWFWIDDSAHHDKKVLLKSWTDFCLFIQNSILLVKIPSWLQAVRPYELFFWHLLAEQRGSGSHACHHSKEHVHTVSSDFKILDGSALGAIMYF